MSRFSKLDQQILGEFVSVIHRMHERGESPATSGNYSMVLDSDGDTVVISESGIDKSNFSIDNLIRIDKKGNIHQADQRPGRKSSDETFLHLMIYKNFKAGCVLHSHSLGSIFFAEKFQGKDKAEVYGLEILKGFTGNKTHEVKLEIPIYDNSQDIEKLSRQIEKSLNGKSDVPGFILRGHGLYAWGADLQEAKRHLEVFNYLFDYFLKRGGN